MIVVVALVALLLAYAWWKGMKRRHGGGALFWRFVSGAALDGRYRTDASWLHWSTVTLHPHRVVRWHHMPRLYRAGIRDGATFLALVLTVDIIRHPTGTLEVAAGVALLAVLAAGWWVYRKLRHVRHHWRYVRPLRAALTPMLEGAPPRLAIEPDRTWARIALPAGFVGTDREWEQIDRAVHVKLGIIDPKRDPQLQGAKPYVIYTKSDDPPPARVSLKDIRALIEAAAEHEAVLGLGVKNAPVTVSVDNDSPHVGLSMGSGKGKSVTARNFAAQMAYHGALLVFLDYKLVSHMWARDLPNVCYAGTAAEIHEVLCWLAWDDLDGDGNIIRRSELTRRKELIRYGTDYDGVFHGDVGPRLFMVCEELNATQGRLKAYWKRIGGKGPSPATEALDEYQFIGREALANALLIAQRLSAKASSGSGSADSRENLGLKLFSDPEESTWKMLVGKRHALPPASGHTGRLQVVTADDVREVQCAFFTPREARELASAGRVAIPQPDMPCVTRRAPVPAVVGQGAPAALGGSDQGIVVQQGVLVPSRPPGTVTLREAVDGGMWPTLDAARQAKQRHKPAKAGTTPRGDLYRIEDLEACRVRRG